MKKHIIIALIIFFIFFSLININGQENELKKITLDEFIELALENSYFQEILKSELQLVYEERLKVPPGELILSVLAEYQLRYDKFIVYELEEGEEKEKEEITETYHSKYGVGLSKLFAYTGTKVIGDYSVLIDNNKNQTHELHFGFEQSIVKNAFGNATWYKKIIAGYERQVAYYQVIEAYEDYLASIITLFIDWYSAYENLNYAEKSLEESQTLLKNVQNKRQYNIALPIDVHKSELEVLRKKEELSEKQLDYKNLLFQIKKIISSNDSTTDTVPIFDSFYNEFPIDLNETYKSFQKESRTFEVMKLINKTKTMSLVLAVDDFLPAATLYGGYTFHKEYNELVDPPNDVHTIDFGIKMEMPIPQIGTFADLNNKKIEKDKIIINQKNKMQDIWVDFNILFQRIENEKYLLEISDKKIELTQKIVNEEIRRYNKGLSSYNEVNDVYNSLNENRLSQINHKILYAKFFIEWLRLSDTLVTNNKEIDIIKK